MLVVLLVIAIISFQTAYNMEAMKDEVAGRQPSSHLTQMECCNSMQTCNHNNSSTSTCICLRYVL